MWQECYRCIRKFYDNPIIIIDDNSNKELLGKVDMTNTVTIESEYPGAGEILPYYYLHRLKPFSKAVVLHDSMFIQERIDFDSIQGVKMLWHFEEHKWDETDIEVDMLLRLNHRKYLLDVYCRKDLWYGCFGAAYVIDVALLDKLFYKLNLFTLMSVIKDRRSRMAIERVLALIMYAYNLLGKNSPSMFGSIHKYPVRWGYTLQEYLDNGCNGIEKVPMVKVWSGR